MFCCSRGLFVFQWFFTVMFVGSAVVLKIESQYAALAGPKLAV